MTREISLIWISGDKRRGRKNPRDVLWHYFNYWEDATSAHVSALSYRTGKTGLAMSNKETASYCPAGGTTLKYQNLSRWDQCLCSINPLNAGRRKEDKAGNILISWEVTRSHTLHLADSLRIFLWVFCLLETIYSNTVESRFVKRRTIFVYWCWLYIVLYFKLERKEFPLTRTKLSQSQLNKHSNCKEETQLSRC